jgi:hypothetical protein
MGGGEDQASCVPVTILSKRGAVCFRQQADACLPVKAVTRDGYGSGGGGGGRDGIRPPLPFLSAWLTQPQPAS